MEIQKCLSKDYAGKDCVFRSIDGTTFCKFHQYMVDYTPEMLVNLERCNGCKKMYYFEDDRKTCDKCRERGAKNKVAKKETEVIIFCGKGGCKFKRSDENRYCGKHQICLFEDETRELNKKLCYNYIRGCREQLDQEYKFNKCEECLEKEREKDRKRRSKVNEVVTETIQNEVVILTKQCSFCRKSFPLDKFIGEKVAETKTCFDCRAEGKKNDLKRDKEHRNAVARKNEAKPERKAVKKKWEENNYEKVALKTLNYRQRKMDEDQEAFLKRNAENAKKWRENNSEKMLETNENKKNSTEINYSNYKRNAEYKNLDFTINYEEYVELVAKDCHYCGIIQDRGFNGIDRKDQTKGYVLENCVSCCKICNYMKGSTSDEVFIKRVEHILTFQGKIKGNLYPDCFSNHKSVLYCQYRNRALKKQLDFLLTPYDYERIIKNDCYLCGKKNEDNHTNGIDRINNKMGYLVDNVKSCCCECNYMKKDYELDYIFDKFGLIYKKHENEFIEDDPIPENYFIEEYVENENENKKDEIELDKKEKNRLKQRLHRERMINEHGIEYVREKQKEKMAKLRENNKNIGENKNKQTEEEKREKAKLRKQKQRENMREKYGDEEYKKMRAKEIADNRKKNKE